MDDYEPRKLFCESIQDGPGIVGRAVVDNHPLERPMSLGCHAPNRSFDELCLVSGGSDYDVGSCAHKSKGGTTECQGECQQYLTLNESGVRIPEQRTAIRAH